MAVMTREEFREALREFEDLVMMTRDEEDPIQRDPEKVARLEELRRLLHDAEVGPMRFPSGQLLGVRPASWRPAPSTRLAAQRLGEGHADDGGQPAARPVEAVMGKLGEQGERVFGSVDVDMSDVVVILEDIRDEIRKLRHDRHDYDGESGMWREDCPLCNVPAPAPQERL